MASGVSGQRRIRKRPERERLVRIHDIGAIVLAIASVLVFVCLILLEIRDYVVRKQLQCSLPIALPCAARGIRNKMKWGGSMNKTEVRTQIERVGILPAVRVASQEDARFAAETVYAAGIPVIEITLTVPRALELIRDLATRYPDLAVGAGTVLDEESAQRCVDAGARFLTSPGFVPEVVAYARQTDTAVLPGALTPTEVIASWRAGADFVKIFPLAPMGGVQYVRALKVPLPQIPLIATGGVDQLTAFDFILAGVSAIGVGTELLPKDALQHRQEHRIHELARRFLTMVKEARTQRESA
jgi:2-dehydro-3-deoxyphosphogluconate aldolase/(4S)-4-hydroxy-2-oxoglutarate aldolase